VTGDNRLDYVCADDQTFPDHVWDVSTAPGFTDVTNLIPPVSSVSDSFVADFDGDLRNDLFVLRGTLHKSGVIKADTNTIEANLEEGQSFTFKSAGTLTVNIDASFIDEAPNLSMIRIGSAAMNPESIPFTLDPADPKVAGMPNAGSTSEERLLIGYNSNTQTWTMEYAGAAGPRTYFIVDSSASVTNVAIQGLGARELPTTPALLLHKASGFVESTSAAGLSAPVSCSSANAGDLDNDGDVDLYLVCTDGVSNLENILYVNDGTGKFTQQAGAGGAGGVTGAAITDGAGTGENVVIADYDVDGFLDLFVTNGLNKDPKVLGGPDQLFHNDGNSNHWVELDLVGTVGNRDAVGARVQAVAGGKTQLRVQDGGYHRWAHNHKRLHFGLAGAQQVNLTVEWPGGAVEHYNNVGANGLYRVTEGSGIQLVDAGGGGGGTPPGGCGAPSYEPASDSGLIVYQDCATSTWHIQAVAADGFKKYSGDVTSSQMMLSVTPDGLEGSDVLDVSADSRDIDFVLKVSPPWEDGFSFSVSGSASTCVSLTSPGGATILYGPDRTPVSSPFDLATGAACL
jgi:hypothetical protein